MLNLLTFSILCLTAVLAALPHEELPLAGHQNLMDFMVKSLAASKENLTRYLDCFDYYIPILNGIMTEYQESYAACIRAAEDAYDKIDDQTQLQRNEIEEDARSACNAFVNCVSYENSIDYFSCFEFEGASNSKRMYNISVNSANILINIREQYYLVQIEQYHCTNASKRVYVENTASTIEKLQSCLEGKSPVPTTAWLSATTTAAPTEIEPISEDTTNKETIPILAASNEDHNNDVDKDPSVANTRTRSLQEDKWPHV